MNKFMHFLSKNSSTIFTGMSVTCSIASVILAVNATPKAVKLLNEKKVKKMKVEYDDTDNKLIKNVEFVKLTKKEIIKTTWKCYIPTGLALAGSIGFAIASNKAGLRRSAALASLLTASEQALASVTEKSIEKIGEKKTKDIEADTMQDKVNRYTGDIIRTGQGDTLFYDDMCGRMFTHNIEKVRARINDLNENLLDDMTMTLNDLYYALGIPSNTCGEVIGWNINDKGKIEYDFVAVKAFNDEPCLSLKLKNWTPEYDRRG